MWGDGKFHAPFGGIVAPLAKVCEQVRVDQSTGGGEVRVVLELRAEEADVAVTCLGVSGFVS